LTSLYLFALAVNGVALGVSLYETVVAVLRFGRLSS